MFLLFSGRTDHSSRSTLQALIEARENRDISQVPVIVELMRFLASRELLAEAALTLKELTGQECGIISTYWMDWLGERWGEYPPPDRYPEWKIGLLSIIHPGFEKFLRTAEDTARIDLTEVVWGGVVPDGIPDLQDPPTLSPDEADYLFPHDRGLRRFHQWRA